MAINDDSKSDGMFETEGKAPKAATQNASDGFSGGVGHIDLGASRSNTSYLGGGYFYNLEGGSEYLNAFSVYYNKLQCN